VKRLGYQFEKIVPSAGELSIFIPRTFHKVTVHFTLEKVTELGKKVTIVIFLPENGLREKPKADSYYSDRGYHYWQTFIPAICYIVNHSIAVSAYP